jgi:hypothetical protein
MKCGKTSTPFRIIAHMPNGQQAHISCAFVVGFFMLLPAHGNFQDYSFTKDGE